MISASDRQNAVELIKEAVSNGLTRMKACAELGIIPRTFARWCQQDGTVKEDQRRYAEKECPQKLSSEEEQRILDIVNSPEYASEPPAQIVNDLLEKGIYLASESTFYRLLRKAKQQNHRGRTAVPVKRAISTHSAEAPNQLWSWDITYLCGPAKGLFYYLYLIIDLYSRKVVGWEIYDEESGENASELVQKAVLSEKVSNSEKMLILHSDNGSPMKSSTLRATMEKLGVLFSHSRPRVSNDNAYSESIFKTLKYRPAFPTGGFKTIEEARTWTHHFVTWYNEKHRHSGLNYVTPVQRHEGQAEDLLKKRKQTLEEAKKKFPNRWRNRDTKDCSIEKVVWLNPEKKDEMKS